MPTLDSNSTPANLGRTNATALHRRAGRALGNHLAGNDSRQVLPPYKIGQLYISSVQSDGTCSCFVGTNPGSGTPVPSIPVLTDYAPEAGATVWGLKVGTGWFIIGRVYSSTANAPGGTNNPGWYDGWVNIGAASAPAFANGWANVGGANVVARFRRMASGLLLIQGAISGGGGGTTAFTLPAGYRPSGTLIFAASGGTITVTSAGLVQPSASPMHLEGIDYYTDQ